MRLHEVLRDALAFPVHEAQANLGTDGKWITHAVALRSDYDGGRLCRLAKASDDANQTRRLLALALIYDGGLRSAAASVGGVGLQVVRDWVLRFNAEGPDGLIDRKAPGKTPKLTARQRRALAAMVESGPISAVHGVVRWRLNADRLLRLRQYRPR